MSFQISKKIRLNLYDRGIFPVMGDIDFEVINDLLSFILGNRPEKKKFTILINSTGGSPSAVCYFWSMINALNREVRLRGVAFGECGSAAFALLQCCTTRYGVAGCGFFIHNMQYTPKIDCKLFDKEVFEDELNRTKKLEDELVRLQCQRIGMSESDWYKLAHLGSVGRPREIHCDEAHDMKLIDRVLPYFEVF